MAKLLINMFFFLFLCATTLCVTEYILVHRPVEQLDIYRKKYSDCYDKSIKSDLIIIGASHGIHDINPKILETLNCAAYNYCFNGASPSFTLNWLSKYYLKHNKLPKIIIYDVNWFMFNDKWLIRSIENDSAYLSQSDALDLFCDRETDKLAVLRNRYVVLNGAIYKRFFKKDPAGVPDVLIDQYYKGYIPLIPHRRIEPNQKDVFTGNNDKALNDFMKVIRLIKKNGSRLILVQSPDSVEFITKFSSDYRVNNEILKKIATNNRLEFLDYDGDKMSDINRNKDLYYDFDHLNQKGSTLFSQRLARDLAGIL